jgi:DNA-binding NarL/FixJ family response regulator
VDQHPCSRLAQRRRQAGVTPRLVWNRHARGIVAARQDMGGEYRRISVLIADEQPLFARSLEALLGYDDRVEVVGRARDGGEAVELTKSLSPDVVLMDINMPVMDGFEATRRIRESGSEVKVIVLTGSDSRADVTRARNAGAHGYVAKARIGSDLLEAILAAASS